MHMNDEIRIDADRDTVYAALNDVDVLKRAIPGCQAMERISDTEFKATVVAKVGPIKASFDGTVTLSDLVPPESYTMAGEGKGGAAGFAKMRAQIRLTEDAAGTLMSYDVTADVGGKLAQLGGRLIEGTSKKLAGEFFKNFEEMVGGRRPGAAAPARAGTTGPSATVLALWVLAGVLAVAAVVYVIAR